jgi:hypothetical protein
VVPDAASEATPTPPPPTPPSSTPPPPAAPAVEPAPVEPLPVVPAPVDTPPVEPREPSARRVRIQQVQLLSAAGLLTAEVTLETGGGSETVTGRGESAAGRHATTRAAATAAASAVGQLLGRVVLLEGLVVTEDRAVVDLVVVEAGGPRRLHGVAALGGDPATGAVRAVLHAANRRLTRRPAPPGSTQRSASATLGM